MNRRTYLGLAAAGAVGTVAGCTDAIGSQEFPPYPDSNSTELSGEEAGTSEEFDVSLDGPTLIDLKHMGSDDFTVVLDEPLAEDVDDNGGNETVDDNGNETVDDNGNETVNDNGNETVDDNGGNSTNERLESGELEEGDQINPVATVASAVGPYDGRTLHSVDPGRYVLRVLEADAEWEATVYDLPAYDDGVGINLPIEQDGEQYDVIGPINFDGQTTIDFEFSVTGDGLHRVFLTDRTGTESFTVAELEGDSEESVSQEVSGVGYIEVLTVHSWSLELS